MGSGFSRKKKQMREMQQQFAQMQEKMAQVEVKGSAGNGLVTITLSGDSAMKSVHIAPECVDPEDIEGLQDLIIAAYADASEKLQQETSSGLPGLPGMGGLPF